MGFGGAVIFLGVLLILGVVIWGGFTTLRSWAIAAVALVATLLAAGCGYYAAAESHSLPWTIGYGLLAAFSLAVAARHLIGWAIQSSG